MNPTHQPSVNFLKRHAILNLILGLLLLLSAVCGFFIAWQQANSESMIVLTFHGVTDTPSQPWEIKYSDIKKYISSLRRYGFEPLSPADFEKWWYGDISGGRRFLVTFDDGLKSSGDAIKKLKEEEKINSVIFLVTDFLNEPNYLTTEDVISLVSSGTRIGLHGKRHEEAPRILERKENLLGELVQAKSYLETLASRPINLYAYPFGKSDEPSSRVVASAGFHFAFTVTSDEIDRKQNSLFLPRLMYLRGVEKFGELSLDDWIPPQKFRNSGMTFVLSGLVFVWSAGVFFRVTLLFKSLRVARRNMETNA